MTRRCLLACPYCHGEGEAVGRFADLLTTRELLALLHAALDAGVRKLKLLGGEPLLRADLPVVIADLRARDAALDISLITGGVAPIGRLAACFDAGLSRCNVTVHGWSPAALAQRGGSARLHARRARTLDLLARCGRPVKINYVYTGPEVEADLAGLLDWAAPRPVVVNVLDDLSQSDLGPADVVAALLRLRGAPARSSIDDDPHSLPTTHLHWSDGLEVEVKDHALGRAAPWRACRDCEARARCREGIVAIRLTARGELRLCMHRRDRQLAVGELVRRRGRRAAARAWRGFIEKEAA